MMQTTMILSSACRLSDRHYRSIRLQLPAATKTTTMMTRDLMQSVQKTVVIRERKERRKMTPRRSSDRCWNHLRSDD